MSISVKWHPFSLIQRNLPKRRKISATLGMFFKTTLLLQIILKKAVEIIDLTKPYQLDSSLQQRSIIKTMSML